jgi:uncharacterized spore protein YtfJ
MADFDANEMVTNLMNGISKLGDSVQVIREPITAGNKVIIPAVVAHMGVGAGQGGGRDSAAGAESRTGGGGGGGMVLTPVFLIVDEQGERLVTVPNTFSSATTAFEKLTEAAGTMFSRKRRDAEPAERRPDARTT